MSKSSEKNFVIKLIWLSIHQEWNDYNLRWNDSEYGGVKDLRITPTKLWKPDILMYNRSVYPLPLHSTIFLSLSRVVITQNNLFKTFLVFSVFLVEHAFTV